mmetsp:Transcript_13632/g.12097  ORF Transcript_13632/g.12097 Transcript_13632/m.12097 type:complete len:92 (+) Transcript_13632:448-723(+)
MNKSSSKTKKTINSYWVKLKPQVVPTLIQTTRRFRSLTTLCTPASKTKNSPQKDIEELNLNQDFDTPYFPFPFKAGMMVNHAVFEKAKFYK